MAASVTVNVNVNDKGALTYLTNIDTLIHKINSTPVNVGGKAGQTTTGMQSMQSKIAGLIASAGQLAAAFGTMFVIKNVREALSTMQQVDKQLTNIRKVTNESKENLKQLGDAAYDTASKYGVSADKFLSSAYEFAKAGKSNYAGLAELATKTMLVGDTTEAVASKFLLSADAAYKFNGNLEQLSSVVDKADYINNNYATSLDKIATGMPIVASTASMANMSIDELMAALGTITSVTQETGTKAATALRALILNITGEVGEVLSDEQGQFEVTEQSVKSMSDALKKYGSEAIKAAQASGELIDPIEAIRSLSEAYRNGDLSRPELFDILTSVGGKLRTNQLAALVENFDMFEEILSGLGQAAGTADKEIEQMLDSWDAKANILKNSWTELISDIANTESIKGFLDSITQMIDGLDYIIERITQTKRELADQQAEESYNSYESEFGTNGKYAKELENLRLHYSELTEFDQKRLAYLESQEQAMKQQAYDAQTIARAEYGKYPSEIVGYEESWDNDVYSYRAITRAQQQLSEFQRAYSEAIKEDGSQNRQQISENLNGLLDEYRGYYDNLLKMPYESLAANAEAAEFVRLYNEALEEQEVAAANAEDELNRLTEATDETAEAQQNAAESFNDTTTSIEGATRALEGFSEATQKVKSGAADQYSSAYKTFLKDWEAGKTDSTVVGEAAKLFLTDEVQRSLGYNVEAMGEFLASDFYQGVFNGASGNAAVDMANYLFDHMTDSLAEVVKISQEADGSLSFTYASAEKLASALNLPLPLMQALLASLDEYGSEVEMGWEGTQNLANALTALGVESGEAGMNIQDVANGLVTLGNTDPQKISGLIQALGQQGFIEGFENMDPAAIGNAIAVALGLVEPPKVEADVEVDGEQAQGAVEEATGDTTITANVEVEGGGEGEKLVEDQEATVTVTTEGTEGVQALVDVEGEVQDKDATVTATTVGTEAAQALKDVIDGINSKDVTITANIITNGKVPPFAGGTKDAPGGPALVNEKGPELISDNGRAYIANGGKPAIVSLGKGAIVLTAEETRQAIGNISVNNGINAYASGIPRISSGSGGGGGGSTGTEREKATRTTSTAKEKDPWKELESELKDALSDYNDIAEWYHNQKKHDEEADVYLDAIAKINEARDKYLAAGFKEDSAEVAKLANKIYDYQEKIREAHQHAIDDLEKELDLIDEQIDLAENQGDYQKALELQGLAQDKVAKLLEEYRAAGYSDTSEEILKLANKGYGYASKSDSQIKDLWKDLIDSLKAMQSTQEDANDLAEKQLAVDEAREALTNAQNQRTVRVFNPVTGQWEWIANAKDIASAEEKLQKAEESLLKEQQSQELDALKKLYEHNGNLSDFTIGPGLSALIGNASIDDMNAFATALGLLSGGLTTTADTSAKSIFDSVDSHDTVTQYTFNGVTIDAGTAQNTSLADLVAMISPLAITTNMPA